MDIPDLVPSDSLTIHKVANGYVLVVDGVLDPRTHVADQPDMVLVGVHMWMQREVLITSATPATHEEPAA